MNDEEHHLEQNLAILLRAALGGQARPGPQELRTAWRLLSRQRSRRPFPSDFPDSVLALLGLQLVLLGTWMLARSTHWTGPESVSLPLTVASAWLLVNLAFLPVASLVVFLRRRLHG